MMVKNYNTEVYSLDAIIAVGYRINSKKTTEFRNVKNINNIKLWRKSMKHKMNLNNNPFNCIKNGTKTVELRLNDEKRQLLKENDLIEFINRMTLENILVQIVKLYKYPTFEELYKHFDKISMGYAKDDIENPKYMEEYYYKEEQDKYGVIGIEVRVIKTEPNKNKK